MKGLLGKAPNVGYGKQKFLTNQGRVVGFDNSMSAKPKMFKGNFKAFTPSGDRPNVEKNSLSIKNVPLRRL